MLQIEGVFFLRFEKEGAPCKRSERDRTKLATRAVPSVKILTSAQVGVEAVGDDEVDLASLDKRSEQEHRDGSCRT